MRCKYFKAYELVSRQDYELLGETKVWEIMDPRLLETLDTVKERFPKGSMFINTWYWGMDRHWSGLRTAGSKYWKVGSMHSYGKAVDFVFTEYDEAEVRKYIIEHPEEFPHIRGIEDNISWVHIDVRNRNEVLIFEP
jgi:uncharacterized protein YcbK (DUF882 family)